MTEPRSQQPSQDLNISGSVLESVQIGGVAGRDLNLTQIQGGVGAINVFGTVQVDQAPIGLAQPLSQQEYRWRQVLLDKVKKFWIEGVLAKSLHTKVLIELGLEERSEYVHNPLRKVEEFPANSEQAFPDGTTAADIFEDIGAGRTLLILGEPGSGKTVTLLKLAESLIARAEDNLSQPLPVVVNLSSWAKQRKSIAEWLVQELYEIYGVSKSLGKSWVNQQQLILLLDGLDEIEAPYRNNCVKVLNQFIQEHGLTEMVVCSRIRDYEDLTEQLKLRGAIYVQPLTLQQINQTLEQAGESLSALRTVIQNNAELRAFATSPLILSIMSLAYQGSTTKLPSQPCTPKAQRQQLFDTYINRMLTRRSTTQKYSREQTLRWLTWLAQRMVNASQSSFLIERLQPSWLTSQQRFGYRLAIAMIIGLLGGLIEGIIDMPLHGLAEGLTYGLTAGLTVGLVGGLTLGHSGNIKTVETLKWSWREAWKSSRNGLIGGLIGGSAFGVVAGLVLVLVEGGRDFGLVQGILLGLFSGGVLGVLGGLLVGLSLGLIFGVAGGFRGPAIQTSHTPNQGIWRSARSASIIGLIIGISSGFIGLIIGISAGLTSGLARELFQIVYNGLTIGILGGLICGGSACLRHFTLRLMLYRQGNIPWNYTCFLNYTVDRYFMQPVGGGYIFVHRMLLEHFAQMEL